jgi:hypothetical protein
MIPEPLSNFLALLATIVLVCIMTTDAAGLSALLLA